MLLPQILTCPYAIAASLVGNLDVGHVLMGVAGLAVLLLLLTPVMSLLALLLVILLLSNALSINDVWAAL